MIQAEFRKQVKDAFEHLYDTAYLGTHPLLSVLVQLPDGTRAARAQTLRSILKQAIEAIRPQRDLPANSPEWRSYHALRYRYTQGMTMVEVENTLGISQRQLQRDFHKGLDAVILLLEELRVPEDKPTPAGIMNETNEIDALRDEMNHWQLVREPTDVAALVEGVQKMIQPLVGEKVRRFQVELPVSLKPVLVDSTLTRQALFQVLRLLYSGTGPAPHADIVLRAMPLENQIKIYLEAGGEPDIEAMDWQLGQLLIERQGGRLQHEAGRVAITLPQANPPRVLVIDDNPAIHELFERYLTPNFYEVVHAHGGGDAMQTVLETQPDVILLDVMMPAIDGWQVLQELKQTINTRAIPIVVCSVLKEPELALSLGAGAYLKKPVERLELLATLERLRKPDPAAATPQVRH